MHLMKQEGDITKLITRIGQEADDDLLAAKKRRELLFSRLESIRGSIKLVHGSYYGFDQLCRYWKDNEI